MAQVTTTTLYFIADAKPTAADQARIDDIPGIVMVRNVSEVGDSFEASDFVTAGSNVTIPSQYDAVPRQSVEKPVSLLIVPDALSLDLSDVEHGDLRAIATFPDGTTQDVTTSCAWESATPGTCTIGAATGIVTPVGAGTSVITATYNFAAPGVAGAAYAHSDLTNSGVIIADEAVVAGLITYTFKATPVPTESATAVQVKLGATAAESMENLRAAIMATQYGKGVLFSSDAPVNTKVRADIDPDTPLVLTATALLPGTAGNAIATTETGVHLGWTSTVLAGGTNATTPVTDTTTVTVVA